jgi:hypothetical protein
MRKSRVLSAIAVVGVFAGVLYFAGREPGLTTKRPQSAPADRDGVAAGMPAASAGRDPAHAAGAGSAMPSDPRLRALEVSADNGLIEFVKDRDGKVIREIDQDPSSARFGKPAREYTYSGNQVVGLTTYKHLGNQIQVSRIMVAYKPDGSIEEFHETTEYEPAPKSR